ncbi:hypothetical protein, partial [Streptomyces stelliscabiei]|uniref:hypothetical protein n=1 Tax=Streptomyces stelliscabiei TaxID=146820 RepID=UPI00062C28AA
MSTLSEAALSSAAAPSVVVPDRSVALGPPVVSPDPPPGELSGEPSGEGEVTCGPASAEAFAGVEGVDAVEGVGAPEAVEAVEA